MEKVELLKILREGLKMLSKCEVMRDDYKYIGMYEEFENMRDMGLKYREAACQGIPYRPGHGGKGY